MANNENLIPQAHKLSVEEQSKGGIASGEIRKKKKAMKEQAELLLSLGVNNKKIKNKMKKLGIPEDEMTNQMAIIISMFNIVLQEKKGSVSAFNTLQATIGEKPIEKLEVNTNIDETVQKVNDYFERKKRDSKNE